ncbi:hypothetical protein F751_0333 [Auxenochlorella protothecoides]|uniref:Uncharacterized protein n=1 Tax=Auxenochlorella protothecoides TaxID=3075 RepID=A0A087SB71_AUXPR|nr:hypothetical protein F751_0333 [Auxenochlorella protothecoides]KFM22975.1 hypothetical protein F751_0333 [Auxenochlorella protothecoides]RMZ57453.1 hypothetical protein APUTEX25_004287 [Auxenochlorella protothecoides]|eukprot:RMZ57453.1 hypothetical protein APUTEX25_004287 [Auxenochlorella protothecoides]
MTHVGSFAGRSGVVCPGRPAPFQGLPSSPRGGRPSIRLGAGPKKLNTFDDSWQKRWFGAGYFAEEKDVSPSSMYRKIEKKKVLSGVERLGLLSKAEKAGLTLTKIEQLGLLGAAENLGLLSLAERLLVSDPGLITSASIPALVLSILAAALIPHDTALTSIISYLISSLSLGVAAVLFITGFVVKGLQEEDG